MTISNNIEHLSRKEIDEDRWDECIDQSDNGLIYCHSYYLDCISPDWEALVLNDYEAVMPLPWKKKWGTRYLYQPFLFAQGGIVGENINTSITDLFIKSIPDSFRYIDIMLNYENGTEQFRNNVKLRNNFVLDLKNNYQVLYNQFNQNSRRNIKRALDYGCEIQRNFDIEKVIDLSLLQLQQQEKNITENINRFRLLFNILQEKGMTKIYGAFSEEKLVSSAVFFIDTKRAYYILVGNHPKSKTFGASHLLIDSFIKDHAAQPLLLDFEGSDIPGLANFYNGFGAENQPYPALTINRLPYYLRWLK